MSLYNIDVNDIISKVKEFSSDSKVSRYLFELCCILRNIFRVNERYSFYLVDKKMICATIADPYKSYCEAISFIPYNNGDGIEIIVFYTTTFPYNHDFKSIDKFPKSFYNSIPIYEYMYTPEQIYNHNLNTKLEDLLIYNTSKVKIGRNQDIVYENFSLLDSFKDPKCALAYYYFINLISDGGIELTSSSGEVSPIVSKKWNLTIKHYSSRDKCFIYTINLDNNRYILDIRTYKAIKIVDVNIRIEYTNPDESKKVIEKLNLKDVNLDTKQDASGDINNILSIIVPDFILF